MFVMNYSACTENYVVSMSSYVSLVLEDCLVLTCPGHFQVLGQAGERELQLQLSADFGCSIFCLQIKPRSPETDLTLHERVGGVCKNTRSSPVLWSYPDQESSHEKILLGKSFQWSWSFWSFSKSCWRHRWSSRALASLGWAGHRPLVHKSFPQNEDFLFLSPSACGGISPPGREARLCGGPGVALLATSRYLKLPLHQERGRERKFN